MSRRTCPALLAIACTAVLGVPLAAQEVYGPPDNRAVAAEPAPAECPPQSLGGEIVVCAELEEQSQFRVEATETDGTEGNPRAPNLETQFPMVGPGVSFKGCFIPPCPPPMPKLIDLKAIPEAPPGSDADRVARGLAPTGHDGPVLEAEAAAMPPG